MPHVPPTLAGPDRPPPRRAARAFRAAWLLALVAAPGGPAHAQRMLGTEFWGCDIENFEEGLTQPFGFAVTNPGPTQANVSVETSDGAVVKRVVAPGDAATFAFNRSRMMLETSKAPNAYRITSDVPVAAYQFNPLAARKINTTDASTLLPLPALGVAYRPHSREQVTSLLGAQLPGLIAIVGIAYEPTTVTIVPAGALRGGFLPETPAGTPVTFTLARFEVAQLMTLAEGDDLTGSLVTSDRPIAVFGGSRCAYVTDWCGTCDHLEEQALPLSQWGTDFLAVKSVPRKSTGQGEEPDAWRVVASEPGTLVMLEPDCIGAGPVLLEEAGDHFEFLTSLDVAVSATAPVALAQYFVGQGWSPPRLRTGDPSMTTVVPTSQFDASYLFYTPPTLVEDYVTIVAPTGTDVKLDGSRIDDASFTAIGDTGYSRARLRVADGPHAVSAPVGIGVYCYGYDEHDSYGFPAGGKTVAASSAVACDAGGPYEVGCTGGTIVLDGSRSAGPGPLEFAWSSFSPGIAFADARAPVTAAVIAGEGPHVIRLTVTAGELRSSCVAEVTIVPPGEVSGVSEDAVWLRLRKVRGDARWLDFFFEDRSPADVRYNLYAGTIRPDGIVAYDHFPVTCNARIDRVAPGTARARYASDAGQSHYYLVSASNCVGESTRGFRSDGVERPELPTDCGATP